MAAAIPSACRWQMLVRSFSATKERTCKTMSLRKVPTRSFTLDIYGHVTAQMRQNSADRMERFIQEVSSKQQATQE